MSFITRCPACRTAFKVVGDQLKIADGWVRCGQCQHVFDATLDLEPWWPGLDQAQPAAAGSDGVPRTSALTDPADKTQPVALAASPSPGQAGPEPTESRIQPDPEPDQKPDMKAEPYLEPASALGCAPVSPPRVGAQEPDGVEPERPIGVVMGDTVPASAPAPGPAATPTFVRKAQQRAFWHRTWVRLALSVLTLLLLLLFALQLALHGRAPLLRAFPAAQPVLDALCQRLACPPVVMPAADAVVIDSSVLLRRGSGLYSFQVVLRNQSALEVPSPAIELTLIDIHDQVLVRRVLLPQDWPTPRATLEPGAQWSLQFELGFEGVPERVMTGYRAILFYP